MKLLLGRIPSPLGELRLVVDAAGQVRALDYAGYEARLHRLLREHYGTHELVDAAPPPAIREAIERYFDGDLTAAEGIATATAGSDLQRRVWEALRRIPNGVTATYGQLARELGFEDPRAAIDVGAACGSNPIAIVVPCHRVIASDGSLKGYAGGLHRKRWLLEHEKALAEVPPVPQTARLPGI